MTRFVPLAFALGALAGPLVGAEREPPALTPGARIRLSGPKQTSGGISSPRMTIGTFVASDQESVVLNVAAKEGGTVRVARSEITRIQVSLGRSRTKSVLIGAAIPLVICSIGLASSSDDWDDLGWAVAGLATIPTGAIIGAFFPTEKWQTLPPNAFDAAPPPPAGSSLRPPPGRGVRVAWTVHF